MEGRDLKTKEDRGHNVSVYVNINVDSEEL